MKKLLVLVIIALAIAALLYFPRGASVASTNAATLAVVNTAIEGSRSGAAFAPALDGEVFANGDVVKSNDNGRAVLTFFDGSSLAIDPGSRARRSAAASSDLRRRRLRRSRRRRVSRSPARPAWGSPPHRRRARRATPAGSCSRSPAASRPRRRTRSVCVRLPGVTGAFC